MKKKTIITFAVMILLPVFFAFIYINLSNIFAPDDYGKEYEKVWVSTDGNISFIQDNKKGFSGHNYEYRADFLNNNPTYSTECTVAFDSFFTLHLSGSEILSGESDYNPITHTMKVTIDYVNTKSSFKAPYKAGDIIEFEEAE